MSIKLSAEEKLALQEHYDLMDMGELSEDQYQILAGSLEGGLLVCRLRIKSMSRQIALVFIGVFKK